MRITENGQYPKEALKTREVGQQLPKSKEALNKLPHLVRQINTAGYRETSTTVTIIRLKMGSSKARHNKALRYNRNKRLLMANRTNMADYREMRTTDTITPLWIKNRNRARRSKAALCKPSKHPLTASRINTAGCPEMSTTGTTIRRRIRSSISFRQMVENMPRKGHYVSPPRLEESTLTPMTNRQTVRRAINTLDKSIDQMVYEL